MTNDKIREIFLANGFTVKEGQTDLKPYVYEAARALIAADRAQRVAPAEVLEEAMRRVMDLCRAEWRVGFCTGTMRPVGGEKEAAQTALGTVRTYLHQHLGAQRVEQAEPVAWQERQMLAPDEWSEWYQTSDREIDAPRSIGLGGIPYEFRPLYASPSFGATQDSLKAEKVWGSKPSPVVAPPPGWKLVPVEPTREMVEALAISKFPDDFDAGKALQRKQIALPDELSIPFNYECECAVGKYQRLLAAAPEFNGEQP